MTFSDREHDSAGQPPVVAPVVAPVSGRVQAPMQAPDPGERRSRLRQYQVQLLERMQAARHGAPAASKELGVMIGQQGCLLDLTQVGEIVAARSIMRVPLTEPWYLGLANIRGNLTGIIDLALYQGGPACGAAADSRIVTFAAGLGFNCALLVARVHGLRDLAGMERQAQTDAAAPWAMQRFRDRYGESWTRIDLARLVRDPRFLQVALQGGAARASAV